MNKLEIAIQLIQQAIQGGTFQSVKYYFDIAEEIEREAIQRFYIMQNVCGNCKSKIEMISLNDQFRYQCDCKKGIGSTQEEAYQSWIKK